MLAINKFEIKFIIRSFTTNKPPSSKTKLTGENKMWLNRHVNDIYVKKSHENNFRSRSYYKLQEIQLKFKFIHSNSIVIDLGASPGGWSLAIADILDFSNSNINKKGLLCSVDLLPIKPINNAFIIQGNFLDKSTQDHIMDYIKLAGNNSRISASVIVSDMLHNVTGDKVSDHYRSIDLCYSVLEFSHICLDKHGSILCKYLNGADDKQLYNEMRKYFHKVNIVKPQSSRSESSEFYMLATDKI